MTTQRDHFIDAMTKAAELAGDADFGKASAGVYTDNETELLSLVRPDDYPSLAFLAFLQDGNANRTALAALLEDRLVLVWTYGIFGRKKGSTVIPFSAITRLEFSETSSSPSFGGNPEISIATDRPWNLAIPPKGTPLAGAVRDQIALAIPTPG
ncbi:hypothetical protein [Arthrobacter sp. KNU40]|uniref:hypothetical protein n=1 Tax=Arthrobacter sp. KNU40 TaxID=3447965 RepID=UPI003F5EBC26